MTLAAVAPIVEYLENGVSLDFAVPFQFADAADIEVTRISPLGIAALAVIGADYTVTGGAGDTGSVTMAVAEAAGWTLRIRRVTARSQPANYATGDSFPAETLEGGLDRVTAITQEIGADLDLVTARAMLVPAGETAPAIPAAADRAGKFALWSADGLVLLSSFGNSTADAGLRDDLADPDVGAYIVARSLATLNAPGDDSVQTAPVQAAYDILSGADGGNLRFAAGDFRTALQLNNRAVGVAGEGPTASVIKPATVAGVALRAVSATAAWDMTHYRDLGLTGIGTKQGTGFKAGPDVYTATSEYIVAQVFAGVRFANFNVAAEFPRGNIGIWFEYCQFEAAKIHIHAVANDGTDGDPMHAGCKFIRAVHMQGADDGSIVIDGTGGGGFGQFVAESGIQENIPGWCFNFKNCVSTNGQPGISIRDWWNEGCYTAVSVTVNGVTSAPGWARFESTDGVLVVNSAVGPLTLVGGQVVTDNCDLSKLDSLSIDAASSLIHDRARQFVGQARGLVASLSASVNVSSSAPVFPMPRPTGPWPYSTDALNNVVYVTNAQTAETWTGSATPTATLVNDPGLPWLLKAMEFSIDAGQTLAPGAAFTIPPGKYVVLKYLARLVSGPAIGIGINGDAGILSFSLNDDDYRCYTAIFLNSGGAIANEDIYHTAGGATSVYRIAGIAVVAFATYQEALAFANSPSFPVIDRPAYTVTNATTSRSIDCDTVDVAGLADFVATLVSDLQKGRLPK